MFDFNVDTLLQIQKMSTKKKEKNDDLGNRMKTFYEDRTRIYIPRKTNIILRLDGKAFHTYTKGLKKPFDTDLATDIDNAVIALMSQIQGAKMAYCQSDEISILITDYDKVGSDAWFDGNVQKISSVSSSILTAEFNRQRIIRSLATPDNYQVAEYSFDAGIVQDAVMSNLAYFDCRVFTISLMEEVNNYFYWRQQDCIKNSISMVAQSIFSPKELHGKNSNAKLNMIWESTGKGWNEYPEIHKNGRVIVKEEYIPDRSVKGAQYNSIVNPRTRWVSRPAWLFLSEPNKIAELVKPKEIK